MLFDVQSPFLELSSMSAGVVHEKEETSYFRDSDFKEILVDGVRKQSQWPGWPYFMSKTHTDAMRVYALCMREWVLVAHTTDRNPGKPAGFLFPRMTKYSFLHLW